MEQIQQHEWSDTCISGILFKCLHCECGKLVLRTRIVYYTISNNEVGSTEEEPACITRYPEQEKEELVTCYICYTEVPKSSTDYEPKENRYSCKDGRCPCPPLTYG